MADNFYGPEDMAEYYRMTKPNILTDRLNGDHIRAMTDEELARYFSVYCWSDDWCKHQRKCEECWLEWLKQEATDEH